MFSLNLTANRLGGFIPTELGLLSTVNTLDFTDNKLFRLIPTEFGEL
jgi:Leucine-rich repeat (LRR) protein